MAFTMFVRMMYFCLQIHDIEISVQNEDCIWMLLIRLVPFYSGKSVSDYVLVNNHLVKSSVLPKLECRKVCLVVTRKGKKKISWPLWSFHSFPLHNSVSLNTIHGLVITINVPNLAYTSRSIWTDRIPTE